MYWALGLAAVGIATYAWLSGEEQSALNSYYSSSRRLVRETQLRQQQLHKFKKSNKMAHDFYKHIELHYQSVLTANACYANYDEHKQMIKMVSEKKNNLIKLIIEKKKQRDAAHASQKQQIRDELKIVRNSLAEAKQELANIKQNKKSLLESLRLLNHETREFKLYIRDNCGKKGRDWYSRGLERRHA